MISDSTSRARSLRGSGVLLAASISLVSSVILATMSSRSAESSSCISSTRRAWMLDLSLANWACWGVALTAFWAALRPAAVTGVVRRGPSGAIGGFAPGAGAAGSVGAPSTLVTSVGAAGAGVSRATAGRSPSSPPAFCWTLSSRPISGARSGGRGAAGASRAPRH